MHIIKRLDTCSTRSDWRGLGNLFFPWPCQGIIASYVTAVTANAKRGRAALSNWAWPFLEKKVFCTNLRLRIIFQKRNVHPRIHAARTAFKLWMSVFHSESYALFEITLLYATLLQLSGYTRLSPLLQIKPNLKSVQQPLILISVPRALRNFAFDGEVLSC